MAGFKSVTLEKIKFETPPKVLLVYLMMDQTSIHSTRDDSDRMMSLRPLLGLQYLAAATRKINVESVVLDQRIIVFDEQTLAHFVEENDILLVGFYTSFSQTEVNSSFVKNLKQLTQVPIVMGGPGYTDYEELLKAGADFICEGEGELTIVDLIENIQNNKNDWSKVDSISYVHNGNIIVNKRRNQIENLDDLSFPLRDNLIPPTAYHDYHLPGFKSPYAGILTNRGCPRKCTFCDSPNIWDQTVRHRSVDNVMEEIDYLVNRWGVRYIDFVDDIFGIDHHWAEEFSNKLIERNYGLKFKILMNPSSFGKRQDKILRLLAKAGLDTAGIGVQTADEEMLVKIKRKGEGKEQLKLAIKSCDKYGILSFVNFILGMPGEEINTAAQKIKDLLDEAKPLVMDCYPYVELKGTEIAIDIKEGRSELKYDYATRYAIAQSVVRYFYLSPINLFNIGKWFLLNNPRGIIFRFTKLTHVLQIMGFKYYSDKEPQTLPIH